MREVDTIPSRIEQVTVFASGARVRRTAQLPTPTPARIRIGGLPLAVIDDTVRADVTGSDRVVATALRVGLATPTGDTAPEESADLRTARTRHETAQSEVQRLDMSLERLVHSQVVVDDPSDEPPAAWSAVIAARRQLVSVRAERQLALRQQLAVARHEADQARRALDVATERDHRSGSARAAKAHEQRKFVELDLTATPGADTITIAIEYHVAAARWAPSYVARLDVDGAQFELRAVVAQASGEDWTGVALRLSTAEPDLFAELPELHPLKIGRRQAEPAKRGFRAPPAGAEALYADYVTGFPQRRSTIAGAVTAELDESTSDGRLAPPPPPASTPSDPFVPSGEVWDEGSSRSKDAYPEQSAPMPKSAPMPARGMAPVMRKKGGGLASAVAGGLAGAVAAPFALAAQSVAKRASSMEPHSNMPGAAGGGAMLFRAELAPVEPTPRLDYGNLVMGAADSAQRGRLVPVPKPAQAAGAAQVAEALAMLIGLPLPPGHDCDWAHTYDYAFASDGAIDVKADGAWHSIAVTSRAGTAAIRHVAVPREQADVFRVATIKNPFDGPLLPAPIDVYDRGQFLLTSEVDFTPPRGSVEVGLGVDATVKIARNSEYREEAAGMLRGALKLFHVVTVEAENLSPRAITLEVRERVPTLREGEDEIKIRIGKVEPAWERWTPDPDAPDHERLRGTHRWRVEVPPATKKLLRAAYEVEIASKHELVGGNRREP